MKKNTLVLLFLFAFACENTPKKNKTIPQAKQEQTKPVKETDKKIVKSKEHTSINVKTQASFKSKNDIKETEPGFLFVNISRIYSMELNFALLDKEKDTLIAFMNKKTYFKNNVYETMDEDGFYKRKLNMVALDPEYGLFILKSYGLNADGYYAVEVNKDTAYVFKENHKNILEFKSPKQFVMEGYPNPTMENPLRIKPNENADLASFENYEDFMYKGIKFEGDWIKLNDDKECYGDKPSETNISGWIRWRKEGEIVVDLSIRCW